MQKKEELQYQILVQWQHELQKQSQNYLESVSRFYLICRETENDFKEIRNHLHGEQRDLLKFQCELDELLKNVEIQLSIENHDSHFKFKEEVVRLPSTAASLAIHRNQHKSSLLNRICNISLKLGETLTSNVTVERIRQSTETELIKEKQNSEQRDVRLYVLAEKLKDLTNELENVLINSNVKKSQQWNQNNGNSFEYKCNNQSVSLCENSSSNSVLKFDSLDNNGRTDKILCNTPISLRNIYSVGHTKCSCKDIQKQHDFFENAKAELVEYLDYRCRYRKKFTAEVNSDKKFDKVKRDYFCFKTSNCDSLNELLKLVENQLLDFWVKNDKEFNDRVTQCSIGVQTETLCQTAQPKPVPVSVLTEDEELKLKPVQEKLPAQTTARDSSVISASSFASIKPYLKPDSNSESGDLISLDLDYANFTLCNDFEEKKLLDKNFLQSLSTPPPILLPPPPFNWRPRSLLERYKEMSKRLGLRDFPNGSGSGPDSSPATATTGGFNSHHYYLGKLVDILEFSRQNHTEYVETMELNKYISILTTKTKTTATSGLFIGYGNTPLEATEMSISIAHNNLLNSQTGMKSDSGRVGPCLNCKTYRSGFLSNARSGSAPGNANNNTVRKNEWGNEQKPDFDGRHLGCCGDGDKYDFGSISSFHNLM